MISHIFFPDGRMLNKGAIQRLDYETGREQERDKGSYMYTHVPGSMSHNSQKEETAQVSIERRMDKQNEVCTHNEILFSPQATMWMNAEDIMLT